LENQSANCTLRLEPGQTKMFTIRLKNLRTLAQTRLAGITFIAKELPLSALLHAIRNMQYESGITHHLPHGYNHLDIDINGQAATTLIISAPLKSYSDATLQKSWGA